MMSSSEKNQNEKNLNSKMDIIWAPWRMAYIKPSEGEGPSEPAEKLDFLPGAATDCFLCQAAATDGGIERAADRWRFILGRTGKTVTLLNRYPYNNGHLLVAPKRHVSRIDLLTAEERMELFDAISFWVGKLEKAMNPDGFNVGLNLGRSAGAGLPGHLHWHLVPRWNGDTNFITTVGSAKVIPQSMEALWELLAECPDSD